MTTYTIRISNKSKYSKNYVAFMEPPQVTNKGGSQPVYTNAWVTFENITEGGYDKVVYSNSLFAYWSQPDQQLSPSTIIGSGGNRAVNTGTRDQVTFSNTGAVGFSGATVGGQAQDGSFSIVTGTDFTADNGYVLGMASNDGSPIPSPVATFEAQPNEIYNITPVVKFFVADGLYQSGSVIDYSAVSAKGAAIDFTGQSYTVATVVHDEHGAFTVTYS